MQTKLSIAALGACLLLAVGCSKEDQLSSELESSFEGPKLTSAIAPQCDVISFSNLPNGALISSVTSDGGLVVAMTSWNSRSPDKPVASMVLNSAAPQRSLSYDLGTPNEKFEIAPGVYGPGVGEAGESGPYVNDVPLGNIMVIKNFSYSSQVVEDDAVSWIAYDFGATKVTATSITVLDVEENEYEDASVLMYSSKGGTLLNTVILSHTGQNGKEIKSLGNTKGVGYILVNLNGSMGMDDLRFCIEPIEPPSTGCTRTQGYWKNHGPATNGNQSNEWNVEELTLGNKTYTDDELLAILRTPPKKGNGLISLAHQLIAAKLNIANGAGTTTQVMEAIAEADALIGNLSVGSDFISSSRTSRLTDILTRYNEGKLGIPHCDD